MLLTGPPETPHLYGVWCDGWDESTDSFLLYLIETTERTIYSSTISVASMPASRRGRQENSMYIKSLLEVSKTYISSASFSFKIEIEKSLDQIKLICHHNNLVLFSCTWPHGYQDTMPQLFQQFFVASHKVNSSLQQRVCVYQDMIKDSVNDLKKAAEDMDEVVQEKDEALTELMKKFTIILNAKKQVINELRAQMARPNQVSGMLDYPDAGNIYDQALNQSVPKVKSEKGGEDDNGHGQKRPRGRPKKETSIDDNTASNNSTTTSTTSVASSKRKSTTNKATKKSEAGTDMIDLSAEKPVKKAKRASQVKKESTEQALEMEKEKPRIIHRNAIDFDDEDDESGMQVQAGLHSSSSSNIGDMKPTLKAGPSTTYRMPVIFDDDDDD